MITVWCCRNLLTRDPLAAARSALCQAIFEREARAYKFELVDAH